MEIYRTGSGALPVLSYSGSGSGVMYNRRAYSSCGVVPTGCQWGAKVVPNWCQSGATFKKEFKYAGGRKGYAYCGGNGAETRPYPLRIKKGGKNGEDKNAE